MGTNEMLSLPFAIGGKMQKVVFCFDVDGTLVDHHGRPCKRYVDMVITLHKAFKNTRIVIWSGGGNRYAEDCARRLGLEKYAWKFMSKHQYRELRALGYYIIAIDDIHDTAIGDANLIVRHMGKTTLRKHRRLPTPRIRT